MKTFNLSRINKVAFYDDGKGLVQKQTRAMMNCWKLKMESEKMGAQEAYMSCLEEYQNSKKNDWGTKYANKNLNFKKIAFGELENLVNKIKELMTQEEEFKNTKTDIPEINEPDYEEPGDNYMPGMSAEEYKESLIEPYIDVKYEGNQMIKVYFIGNNAPSSVNAGLESKHYLTNMPIEFLDELRKEMKNLNIDVVTTSNVENAYNKYVKK